VLRGGDALAYANTLVSFDRGAILRTGFSFAAARPDGARILACDEAAGALAEIDTVTGAETARFAASPSGPCPSNGELSTEAAYTPDPRRAFWIERGPERKEGGPATVVAVGDTRTGRVQRLVDRRATWSIAVSAKAHLDETGAWLCGDFFAHRGFWTTCDWKVDKGGRAVRDPRPDPSRRPSPAALGLAGAVEVARAWTPRRERVLVLTFRRKGDEKRDYRLTVAAPSGKVERSVVLEAGEFFLDDSALNEGWTRTDGGPGLPGLEQVGDDKVVVTRGVGNLGLMIVDLRTGAVTKPCPSPDECGLVGRYLTLGAGTLREVSTGATVQLTPSAAEWEAAPRAEAPCP
jgi:hypothetical protein